MLQEHQKIFFLYVLDISGDDDAVDASVMKNCFVPAEVQKRNEGLSSLHMSYQFVTTILHIRQNLHHTTELTFSVKDGQIVRVMRLKLADESYSGLRSILSYGYSSGLVTLFTEKSTLFRGK